MNEPISTPPQESSPTLWATTRRQSIADVKDEIHGSNLPPETKDALMLLMNQTYAATNGANDRLLETANLCGDLAIAFTRFLVRDQRSECQTDCAVSKVMEQCGMLTRDSSGNLVPTDKMKEAFQPVTSVKKTVITSFTAFAGKNPVATIVFILYFVDMALRNPDKFAKFINVVSAGMQLGGG